MFGLTFEYIAEFLIEFVHATSTVNDFLLTSVERMAFRANLNREVFFSHSRFGNEFIAARASYVYIVVIRMNTLFHDFPFDLAGIGILPMLQS